MKIIYISGGNIPSKFAHSIQVMKMAQGFADLGHDVELLVPTSFRIYMRKKSVEDIYAFYGVEPIFKITYIPTLSPFVLIKRSWGRFSSNVFSALFSEIRKPDLVYCREYVAPYVTSKLGIPTMAETHSVKLDRGLMRWLLMATRQEAFKKLIILSENVIEKYTAKGVPREKIIALESGVDLKRFNSLLTKEKHREMLGLPVEKRIIVYCGSLYPDKGIEHILLSAKNLPDALFLLVGGRKQELILWKEYAKSHEIENAQFIGFIENNKVPFYLKAADALIMPYKTDQEIKVMDINTTSPLKLFEYMASRRPIVSTDVPAISRVLTHNTNGLLAEPNNIEELTYYTRVLLEDEGLSKRLAENAYRKVQNYDWKKRCEKILQFA